jgi:hypothetical protein
LPPSALRASWSSSSWRETPPRRPCSPAQRDGRPSSDTTPASTHRWDAIVKEGTDACGLAAARQFADIIVDQLPVAIDQLTGNGFMMEKEEMRRREIEVLPGF